MKAFAFLALFIALACASDVITLDKSNFDSIVNNEDFIFVKFYAPWCGHCKRLAPDYEKAASILKKEGIKLAEVDADKEKDLAQRFGITGFPTLKFFHKGKPSDYQGPRSVDGLVKAIRAKAGPAAKELKTVEEFDKFIANKEDVSIVGFFASKDAAKEFLAAATAYSEDYRFGVVYSSDIIAAKNKGANGIVNYRPFDKEDAQVVYGGDINKSSDIQSWIDSSSIPLAGLFKPSFEKRYKAKKLPRLAYFAKVSAERDPAGLRYILNRLRKVAKEFSGKILFTTQPFDSTEGRELSLSVNTFVVFDGSKRYTSDLPFSVDNIKKVAEDFLAGKLEEHIKSEPIPTTESIVQHVVGRNFDKEVMESKQDVFIKFYAPWCGHCKALAPKYEELAKNMKKYKSVKIVELDATANEYPRDLFTVNGFPTLYLLKANDKKHPVQYSGDRSADSMEKWIKKQVDVKTEL